MALNQDDIYYQAMLSRDYRFDGKFYTGVKTTGIYCRPICPAKPKRKNVEFFTDRLAAEKAGYRPCMRCHPEYSPETLSWPGKSPVVQKALQLIAHNALLENTIESIASHCQVSSRHLRRLFEEEVGMSPKQISDVHRLNFAYKLTKETALSLTDVALTAGFGSLRRFNDAFLKRYNYSPRTIRKGIVKNESPNLYHLSIAYRPPFDWETLLAYFAGHQIPHIETVTSESYHRVFKENNSLGSITITNNPTKAQLELEVYSEEPKSLFSIVNRVKKMFDLDSDPLLIANQFSKATFLNALWNEFPGLRIGRGWDPFEIAVGTILGQVVSVKQTSNLMGALVENYGEKMIHPITQEEVYLFPSPQQLAGAALDEIKTTAQRKISIKALCQAVINGELNFNEFQNLNQFKAKLQSIKGVGNWSVEYISLRGLGDTNAFPKSDLILKRALKHTSEHFDHGSIAPWQGYLAIYLWRKYASILTKKRGKNGKSQI